MRLEPESIRGEHITPGSVMIAETDPIRRSMIGLAPLFSGLLSLITLSYLLGNQTMFPEAMTKFSIFNLQFSIASVIIYYLFFAISNTMFPSPQDMKGVWPVATILGIVLGLLYFFGIRIALTGQMLVLATRIAETLTQSLGLVAVLNIALFIVTWILSHAIARILRLQIMRA
jgi:hypothetical protein